MSDPLSDNTKLQRKLRKLGIPSIRRHIMLCCDTGECGCASKAQMKASWRHLRKRLKAEKLRGRGGVFCSRSGCLDVCCDGPIAIVYPEGVWYGRCTEPVLDRIVDEHLKEGRVVEEHVIARPAMGDGA
jgi:(2Fe-2S) ferredoxin